MPEFPVYQSETRIPDGSDAVAYSVRSFDRPDLSWTLAGHVVAPEGSELVAKPRTGRLLLRVPDEAPGTGDRDPKHSELWPGEAMGAAREGRYGLAWKPPEPGEQTVTIGVDGEVVRKAGRW